MATFGISKIDGELGFRDIQAFNKALLTKQVWRLMQQTASLVSQLLKNEYFRNGHILEEKLGFKPSFIWRRSLLSSIEIVKEGMFWRIGNGQMVRIWGDKWLPSPASFRAQSYKMHLSRHS